MKLITGLALAIAMSVGSAFAGEGQISQTGLEAFGLGDMIPVTDAQGMSVRGQGSWAFVGGGSTSRLRGTSSTNVYGAGASHSRRRRSSAEGGSESYSTRSYKRNRNGNILRRTRNNGSWGSSAATAK